MLSLTQARRKVAEAGEPIHSPFQVLEENGIHIRRGQLTLVAAGPGCGKTAMVHAMLHHGNRGKEKNSVMFFSADTPSDIMWSRSASLATGYAQSEVERMADAGAVDSIQAKIQKSESHISWVFDDRLGIDRVWSHLSAYVELHDAFPEVIVVDVLAKMVDVEDEEFRGLQDACDNLVELAKQTGAAVIALHHVAGHLEDSSQPIPLSGLRGKVGKSPSLILTMHKTGDEEARIAPVKNRTGKANASGGLNYGVTARISHMFFSG